MSTRQKRDADMDRLLRSVLKPAPREPDGGGSGKDPGCPDAGDLAAFVEGGLTATEQSAFDAHIVTCGRCQEALAAVSHGLAEEVDAGIAAPETRWFTWVARPRLRWLVPITAAATAAVVFVVSRPLIAPEVEEFYPADEVQTAQAPQAPMPRAATEPGVPREKSAAVPPARAAKEEKAVRPGAAPPPAAPPSRAQVAAARQPASAPAGAGAAGKETVAEADRAAPAAMSLRRDASNLDAGATTVSAPGGTVWWRFGAGGRIAQSADAGATWQAQTSGVTADLLAGAAPAPTTCWIAGAAGTVLLTTDGERWQRRPFPLPVDLVAVEASSASAATVTTRDGRRFATLDGGLTWAGA